MTYVHPDEARAKALRNIELGIGCIAAGFNFRDIGKVTYTYAPDVQSRFVTLACEIFELVKSGEIIHEPMQAPEPTQTPASIETYKALMRRVRKAGRGAKPKAAAKPKRVNG